MKRHSSRFSVGSYQYSLFLFTFFSAVYRPRPYVNSGAPLGRLFGKYILGQILNAIKMVYKTVKEIVKPYLFPSKINVIMKKQMDMIACKNSFNGHSIVNGLKFWSELFYFKLLNIITLIWILEKEKERMFSKKKRIISIQN